MSVRSEKVDSISRLKNTSPEFLERYNRPGPRYTSYPTAPEWSPDVTQEQFRKEIRRSSASEVASTVSLYFHIPFCEHRCRFCACNTIVTRQKEVIEQYLRDLDLEMALVAGEMRQASTGERPVTQIHFGGGTPTYLSPEQFRWLMGRIRNHFNLTSDAEFSIEVDPCVTTDEHLETLAELGFNRISLGVQDFNPEIQKIIERVQSFELTRHQTDLARDLGFESVNFDLVYGLPLQSAETFEETLREVLQLRPDRIALYNFAYLPSKLPHQRILDAKLLPSGQEKFRIFVTAYEGFVTAGYEYIGMDHFAVPEDPLSVARRERTIQRNFMGYTTQAGTDLFAFGTSSISATPALYVQNTKKLSQYHDSLKEGKLPTERGIFLSEDDLIRKETIYQLMCYGRISKATLNSRFGIDFDRYFADELEQLPQFEQDGLLEISSDKIDVTLLGHIFVRNIAMVFDIYLRASKPKATYSRTL